MKKRTISMLLAGAMTMSMIGAASAADDTKKIQLAGDDGATGSSDVALTGEVTDKAVLLSVVVPTSINFTVATKEAKPSTVVAKKGTNTSLLSDMQATYHSFNGLTSGTGTVTNNSNVPIQLEISNVSESTGALTTLMDLAVKSDELSGLTALKTPLDPTTDYAKNPIVLATSIAINGGTTTLEVVGQAAKGTYDSTEYDVDIPNGSYTVTTTLKVTALS